METRSFSIRVTIPNLVALSQAVWAQVRAPKFREVWDRPLGWEGRGRPVETYPLPHVLPYRNWSFYVKRYERTRRTSTQGPPEKCDQSRSAFQVFYLQKQTVRVATRYAPGPLLPRGRPSASRAAEQTQCSSSFPRPIRSHGHRCTCLMR